MEGVLKKGISAVVYTKKDSFNNCRTLFTSIYKKEGHFRLSIKFTHQEMAYQTSLFWVSRSLTYSFPSFPATNHPIANVTAPVRIATMENPDQSVFQRIAIGDATISPTIAQYA